MTETVELKPCPFCGATVWLRDDRPSDTWIECDDCQISTPHGTYDDALAAWNRRTPTIEREAAIGEGPVLWRVKRPDGGWEYCTVDPRFSTISR